MGRACGTAGPRTSPSDTRENVPSEKTNEHENCHRARPAGWPVGSACGFLSPSDAGQIALEPTANGSRLLETSLNHRHFVDARRYRMPLHTQGGFRRGCSRRASFVSISLPAWSGCSRVVEPNNLAFGDASHCCTARLKRLQLERLRALVKH